MIKLMHAFWAMTVLFSTLYADLADPTYIHAATEGDPSNTICDSVSLLTGDFVVSTQDLVVDGVEPIHIYRHYASAKGEGRYGGWEFFPHIKLQEVYTTEQKWSDFWGKYKEHHNYNRVHVREPNGTILTFVRQDEKNFEKGPVLYTIELGKGITNISRGNISGRTNLRNYVLYQESETHFTLHCANGTKRYYKKCRDGKDHNFRLTHEELPNGHQIWYKYGRDDRLEAISTTNETGSKTYSSCRIHYQYKDKKEKCRDFEILTKDGRRLNYAFLCKGKSSDNYKNYRFFLDYVDCPELANESIRYSERHGPADHLVASRGLPNGTILLADYYFRHSYEGLKKVKKSDFCVDRVKALRQPVGPNNQMAQTHYFTYCEGQTDAFDALKNKTSVFYNKRYLPIETRFHEKQDVHHYVHMNWGEYGQLEEKTVCNAEQQPLLKRQFHYDDRGNPLQIDLTGNFISLGSEDILIEQHQYDEENRLIQSISPSGLITTFVYLGKTPLVTKKCVTDGNAIHIREFYEYSEDNILVCKIIDDGISDDSSDLTGVTERKIERIHLKQEAPGIDLPEILEEWALDLTTNEEILIKKIYLHYNAQCKITQKDIYDADDSLRYSLQFTYNAQGQLIKETDPEGRSTTYSYDNNGNLKLQKIPSQKQIEYFYDNANRVIAEEETTPNGDKRRTECTYDAKSNKIATKDPFGNVTQYEYDAFGHVTQTIHPDDSTESFTYDCLGHLTSYTDPNGQTTYKTHNALGKLLEEIHPDGTCESYTYDLTGNLVSHTNQEHTTTLYSYDALGREIARRAFSPSGDFLKEETFTYNSFHLIEEHDPEGVVTNHYYDVAGRKSAEERCGAHVTFEYDPLGRLYKQNQLNGTTPLTTIFERDLLEQLIQERQESQDGNILYTVSYTYDLQGNQTAILHGTRSEYFIYDGFNRLIAHETGEGHTTLCGYDETHPNERGQHVLRKISTDPIGYQTIETFDVHLRLIRREVRSPFLTTLSAEDYILDPCGNCIIQRTHIYQNDAYIKTIDIAKAFDSMHRVVTIKEAASTSDEKITHYAYTPVGALATTLKPDQTTLTYIYDPLGNLTRLLSSDHTINISYTYNRNGQLLSSTDHIHNASTTRILDDNGNILEEIQANGLKTQYSYDAFSRRTEMRLPTTTIQYAYDPLYLKHITAFGHTATYTYDTSGNVQKLHMFDNTIYYYDKMGRRTEMSSPFYNQTLHYDMRGNIEEMIKESATFNYVYDGLKQLIQEKTHTYTYDSAYNRLSKDAQDYTVNNTHALTSISDTTYTYDSNGNPITLTTPDSTTYYTYDALDRLVEVQTDTTRVQYTYDSFHRRMTKTVYHLKKGKWKKKLHRNFLYDGENELGACDNHGNFPELRILGRKEAAERETLLMQLNYTFYKPVQDLQGNVVRIISLDNTISYGYYYNAFGEEFLHPDQQNPWHYASKRYDPETGLIYFGHRYYNQETGRWLTPDPSAHTDSINLYAYTFNNPLLFFDLYGLNSDTLEYQAPFRYVPFEENTLAEYQYQYALDFPGENPKFETSSSYSLGRPELQDKTIMYSNGIGNYSYSAIDNATYISDLAGGIDVKIHHTASFGFTKDLEQAYILKNFGITRTVVEQMKKWNHTFDNAGPNHTILQYAHSMGCAVVRNALMNYDKERRKRIFVVAIAPEVYIDPEICGGVHHYVSKGDLVHWADFRNFSQYKDTITVLDPDPDAKGFIDHPLQSPTFRESIAYHNNYFRKFGKLG